MPTTHAPAATPPWSNFIKMATPIPILHASWSPAPVAGVAASPPRATTLRGGGGGAGGGGRTPSVGGPRGTKKRAPSVGGPRSGLRDGSRERAPSVDGGPRGASTPLAPPTPPRPRPSTAPRGRAPAAEAARERSPLLGAAASPSRHVRTPGRTPSARRDFGARATPERRAASGSPARRAAAP